MGNGRRLLEYRLDEATNVQESSSVLMTELGFFDDIDQLILDFLNRGDKLRAGESKHYVLCSLVRTQLTKSCNNMLRHHVGDAFAAMRLATDAALFSLLMSHGMLSENDYLTSRRARDDAVRVLGQRIKAGVPFPPIILAIRQVRSDHSSHAHADPIALANRIKRLPGGSIKYSGFQRIDDLVDFRYFFMGMLWVAGMCFRGFLHVQEIEFAEDVSPFLTRLNDWKGALHSHRRSIGIFPERGDEAGF
ncbi:hypothetical protein GFL21_28965 [Rhizobium anhuiense]|uniref:hypothetical protein n=1 Tax=Rhizobium anhuiense TaxID=1184720 RepID=UPI0014414284|nr:hypothetical protein [Rhizobium anhuiense]NKM58479.1 hypothetical protein [Rhizobium anhuiense]